MPESAPAIATDFPDLTNEFLNSLASVHSISEILRDHPGIDSHQKRRFIDILLTETKRMVDLVDQVAELPQLPTST
ncbi:MAG: hypothetical protein [Olavius algarvensis Delta 4 endosymbiont]|nr:MAG: hypothetical protein [Olavius algarvensis Delta 4 endosymbiont]